MFLFCKYIDNKLIWIIQLALLTKTIISNFSFSYKICFWYTLFNYLNKSLLGDNIIIILKLFIYQNKINQISIWAENKMNFDINWLYKKYSLEKKFNWSNEDKKI